MSPGYLILRVSDLEGIDVLRRHDGVEVELLGRGARLNDVLEQHAVLEVREAEVVAGVAARLDRERTRREQAINAAKLPVTPIAAETSPWKVVLDQFNGMVAQQVAHLADDDTDDEPDDLDATTPDPNLPITVTPELS